MKYIFLLFVLVFELFGGVLRTPVLSVDSKESTATIKAANISVGMSGFISHHIAKGHMSILKNIVVSKYDKQTQIATLKMTPYDALRQNSLPDGEWNVVVGDTAILAFGYNRGVLIAPSEDIYYRITRAVSKMQWVHPDIFATILSFKGHPTPLKSDFLALSKAMSVGLVFLYLDEKLYTVDSKSFKILSIADAPLKQESVKLPFYSRVDEIEAAWWGEGSDEMQNYEPYYFSLLKESNPNNKTLQDEIEKFNKKVAK